MIWRRALPDRSGSDSAPLARSRADGTEYQTVTPVETMKRQRLATRPNVEAGTSASRAAAMAAPKKSNTLRSNDGDACWETTSVSCSPTASTAHRTNAKRTGVCVRHALRPAGGTRRVQDVRERRGRHLNRRAPSVELLEPGQALAHRPAFRGPARIEPAPAEPVQRRRVVTRAVVRRGRVAEHHRPHRPQAGDHGDRLGVGGDDVRSRRRSQVVDRHVGAACQQRAEDGDRKRDVLGQSDHHPVARLDPVLHQGAGKAHGAVVQIGVRQLAGRRPDGRPIRVRIGGLEEQM